VKSHTGLDSRNFLTLLLGALLVLGAADAGAFGQTLQDWQDMYGDISSSGDNAQCQLCHRDANGGSPWNAYGWDIREALRDLACDDDDDGDVSNDEAFACVEALNSDVDTGFNSNLDEIQLSTQPGWALGANTIYDRQGVDLNQPAPDDIGPLDPPGTDPVPPTPTEPPDPGPGGGGPGKNVQILRPGDSIQAAIERSRDGGYVYLRPGTYREFSDPMNGLNISKSIHLIGLSFPGQGNGVADRPRRAVIQNSGGQRNGIVVVPEDRQDCMSCHTDLAPPFPIKPGVEPGLKMREPMIHGIEIRGITIDGFDNNGLFTENVDGFSIVDVTSLNNRNYGIFPTLSKNGVITRSEAIGSDIDSGIWVETSENVDVTYNLVEGNVNGIEVSNSDDILVTHNEARNNTIGFAILLLPDIFDDRAGAKRIDMKHNRIHDNNKLNTARPGSILSLIPRGIGIIHLGVDDSLISGNLIENNDFAGIAISDYCLPLVGLPTFQCPPPFGFPGIPSDPSITPEFLADQSADNNTVVDNVLINNGTNPDPGPFTPFAADLTLLTFDDNGNCYEDNIFTTFFSTIGVLPPCN
jgi:parallel beta-helix repeat protein